MYLKNEKNQKLKAKSKKCFSFKATKTSINECFDNNNYLRRIKSSILTYFKKSNVRQIVYGSFRLNNNSSYTRYT